MPYRLVRKLKKHFVCSILLSFSFFLTGAPEFRAHLVDDVLFEASLGIGAFLGTKITLTGVSSVTESPTFSPIFAIAPRAGVRFDISSMVSFGVGGGYRYAFESESANTDSLSYLGLSAVFIDGSLRFSF